MAKPTRTQYPPPTGSLPSVDSSQLGHGVPGPPQRGAPHLGHVATSAVARCGTNEVPPPLFIGEEGAGALNPGPLSKGTML